jgi:hypothetical protein
MVQAVAVVDLVQEAATAQLVVPVQQVRGILAAVEHHPAIMVQVAAVALEQQDQTVQHPMVALEEQVPLLQ